VHHLLQDETSDLVVPEGLWSVDQFDDAIQSGDDLEFIPAARE